ncbi:CYTH domain-containing protein [Gottfriedia solisilvae]|uniref:CYTH domain-containing protein n=1 Tax=Gottfriedia solisilvae TaxID=1516104 RepID=UPI003D2E9F5E
MAKEIEIEFKNLLTKDEFTKLQNVFHITESMFVEQTNYYFETPSFTLKNSGGALRIRQKSHSFVLTLKIRQAIGHLEIHQKLSESEAMKILETSQIPDGEVKEYLIEENIKIDNLALLGDLTTRRVELPYENGLLVLDHSTYLNHEDYELEYEVTDELVGKKHFINLLCKYEIPERKTLNKIKRFFNAKQGFMGEK